MGDVRRPDGGNPCGDRRIGRNHVGEDRYELVAITHHLPSAHIEIETRYELAVAARSYEQRPADHHDRRQRVVGMGREYHIDAGDAGGELAIDVKAVVREQHHQLCARSAHLFDLGPHVALADAK